MTYLVSYGCSTAAGDGVEALWKALNSPNNLQTIVDTKKWQQPPAFPWKEFQWQDRPPLGSVKDFLVAKLLLSWSECCEKLPQELKDSCRSNLGVIFASTKGCIEDYIWDQSSSFPKNSDSIYPVLESFLSKTGLSPSKSTCVSNACSSSHSAIYLADHWLQKGAVESVLIISADFIGPFIAQGFNSLKAVSPDQPKPFSETRNGLQLGDGGAAILLSATQNPLKLKLLGTSLVAVGGSITRPNSSACVESCNKALNTTSVTKRPDLIIAHGTATPTNDSAEDQAFKELFSSEAPPVTASKWCLGHTMASSGSVDLIVAAESIQRKTTFSINQSCSNDPSFLESYLRPDSKRPPSLEKSINKVLVNSMGFGGVHSAAVVEQSDDKPTATNNNTATRLFGELYIHQPNFSLQSQPDWSSKIQRWYQLDNPARSLLESYFYWAKDFPHYADLIDKSKCIVLASSGASNETDLNFAREGASSPSLFSHTLPNIRASVLLEATGWSGPLLCLQFGQRTLANGLLEACGLASSNELSPTTLIGIMPEANNGFLKTESYTVIQLTIAKEKTLLRHHQSSTSVTVFNSTKIPNRTNEIDDDMLCEWIMQPASKADDPLYLGGELWIEREIE